MGLGTKKTRENQRFCKTYNRHRKEVTGRIHSAHQLAYVRIKSVENGSELNSLKDCI
jgi:hypothetical protein